MPYRASYKQEIDSAVLDFISLRRNAAGVSIKDIVAKGFRAGAVRNAVARLEAKKLIVATWDGSARYGRYLYHSNREDSPSPYASVFAKMDKQMDIIRRREGNSVQFQRAEQAIKDLIAQTKAQMRVETAHRAKVKAKAGQTRLTGAKASASTAAGM